VAHETNHYSIIMHPKTRYLNSLQQPCTPTKPDHKDHEWHAQKATAFSKFQSCGLFDRVTCLLVTQI